MKWAYVEAMFIILLFVSIYYGLVKHREIIYEIIYNERKVEYKF